MTDWRQIQARIRKAKNSQEPLSKLSELFQRTRDGMVAWELGVFEEKNERTEEAVKWYSTAAQRFRRADWKKKAEEALTRLGVPLPTAEETEHPSQQEVPTEEATPRSDGREESSQNLALGEIPETVEVDEAHSIAPAASAGSADHAGVAADSGVKKRRRGRRGGRGRRRKGAPADASRPSLPTSAYETKESRPSPISPVPSARPHVSRGFDGTESPHPTLVEPAVPPILPSERIAHGRAGDPGLASRMAHLESMLRRLIASPLHRLDEADQAPAGPGVFLLSDSDQVTSYYVEACQTLRIGVGNMARGSQGGKSRGRGFSDSGLKANLAEHLGIGESRVSQYLRDHCVVRWIQLDDEASHLAHFAIGVLRTPLNL